MELYINYEDRLNKTGWLLKNKDDLLRNAGILFKLGNKH